MLSPIAVTLALAFWTPINGGVNPCPDGVQIDPLPEVAVELQADGFATFGVGCTIDIGSPAESYPVPAQCALVAHELGHAVFSLPHEDGTIMDPYTSNRPIPGACYPAPRLTQTRQRYSNTLPRRQGRGKLRRMATTPQELKQPRAVTAPQLKLMNSLVKQVELTVYQRAQILAQLEAGMTTKQAGYWNTLMINMRDEVRAERRAA